MVRSDGSGVLFERHCRRLEIAHILPPSNGPRSLVFVPRQVKGKGHAGPDDRSREDQEEVNLESAESGGLRGHEKNVGRQGVGVPGL